MIKTIICLICGGLGGIIAAEGIVTKNPILFLVGLTIAIVSIAQAFPDDDKQD